MLSPPTSNHFIGIDPGMSGAIAVIAPLLPERDMMWCPLSYHPDDIWEFISPYTNRGSDTVVVLERVWARPGMSVATQGKMMDCYGMIRGMLVAAGLPYQNPTPTEWQKVMGCVLTGKVTTEEKKSYHIAKAIKWFSGINKTNVDAFLIAKYAETIFKKGN